jgi:hypothetical protein
MQRPVYGHHGCTQPGCVFDTAGSLTPLLGHPTMNPGDGLDESIMMAAKGVSMREGKAVPTAAILRLVMGMWSLAVVSDCGGSSGSTDAGPPSISSFQPTPSWGNAPLSTSLTWNIANPSGSKLNCALDFEGDGKVDLNIGDCSANGSAPHVYDKYGPYSPTLTVTDNKGRSVASSTTVYSNWLHFADNVVFPEKLPDFVSAAVVQPSQAALIFSGSPPEIAPGTILWGTSGEGYLLRVLSATPSGNTVVASTEQARVLDAIMEGFFGARNVWSTGHASCIEGCDGVEIEETLVDSSTTGGASFREHVAHPVPHALREVGPVCDQEDERCLKVTLKFPDLVLPDGTTLVKKPKLSAMVEVTDFVLDVSPLPPAVNKVKLSLRVTKEFENTLEVAKPLELKKDFPLGTFPLGVIPIGPFVITPMGEPKIHTELSLGVSLGLKLTTTIDVLAGFDYDHGELTAFADPALEFASDPTFQPDDLQVGSFSMSLRPQFSTKLFGVAGPFISPSVGVDASLAVEQLTNLCLNATCGLDLIFGASFDVFGVGISVSYPAKIAGAPLLDKMCLLPVSDAGVPPPDAGANDGGPADGRASAAVDAPGSTLTPLDGAGSTPVDSGLQGLETWFDPASNLTWRVSPAPGSMAWQAANDYCSGIGWRLPTIDELRTLIRGCTRTQPGGSCGLTSSCLTYPTCCDDNCSGCVAGGGPEGGCYWPAEITGTCSWYWSSSEAEGYPSFDAWGVDFGNGSLNNSASLDPTSVRCVRSGN